MSDGPLPPDYSSPFRRVADRIDRNQDAPFAGAFVIVTPDGSVEELLLLDKTANPAVFWSIVKTKAEIAIAEIDEHQRRGGPVSWRP